MSDTLTEFEQKDTLGTTTPFVSSVGVSPVSIPSSPDKDIEELSIRCTVDQPSNRRLEFSLDGGTQWHRLKVGESREEEPRGGLKQIQIRAAGSGVTTVDYEIIINFGQL